jgi:transcriptional regulator with GAF, ATPase, and Fis domain
MAAPDAAPDEDTLPQVLSTIAHAIAASLELKEVFSRVAEACQLLVPFDGVGLSLLEPGGRVRVHAVFGDPSTMERENLEVARADYSPRLWPDAPRFLVLVQDAPRELDPAFFMDRDLITRGYRSMLRVPLVRDGVPLGSLIFNSREPAAYTEDHGQAFSLIADLLVLAVEHERMASAWRERRRRRDALEKLLPALAGSLDIRTVFEQVARVVGDVIDYDYLSLGLLSADRTAMRMYAMHGTTHDARELPEYPLPQEGLDTLEWDYVMARDHTVLPGNVVQMHLAPTDPARPATITLHLDDAWMQTFTVMKVRGQLRVPVRLKGETIGSLSFSSRQPDLYREEDVEFGMRVADHVALALAHQRLADEARRGDQARDQAAAQQARADQLERELEAVTPHRALGRSRSWNDVLAQAGKVARTDTTVLLTGESGTGKEVVARFIHRSSARKDGPFVALNCAALPEHLLESELFGHEKGAFTGALAARPGKIEQASGGVLFLDEVGEMSPAVQAKFLRVLQEREYQRLGGSRTLKADARVLAATNRDLKAAIAAGGFREDLYYRLAVFDIALPPLRDRPDDIPLLVDAFLEEIGRAVGRRAAGIAPEAREKLIAYRWPGNVRELRNALERAIILCEGGTVTTEHLPLGISAATGPPPAPAASEAALTLDAAERDMIVRALARARNNKSEAARLLGLSRGQLYSRLEKHGLADS